MSIADTPQAKLSWYIDRFITDSGLAHDFVRGDDTVMVHGEDGDYPSLAMLAKLALQKLDTISEQRFAGMVIRKYSFGPMVGMVINHGLNTPIYEVFIINEDGDIVHPMLDTIDNNNFVVEFTEPEKGTMIVKFYENNDLVPPIQVSSPAVAV